MNHIIILVCLPADRARCLPLRILVTFLAAAFVHMNVGKYGLAALIRIRSPFGVFQENN